MQLLVLMHVRQAFSRIGYEAQWGEGRNDLDVIKNLGLDLSLCCDHLTTGGNAIRLYHSFGYGPSTDHGILALAYLLAIR